MINTLLAKKIKMTQAFVKNTRVPVTVLNVGPCTVTFIKNEDRDGYSALQLGFESKRLKNTSNAVKGHLKATTDLDSKKTHRYLKEVRGFDESLKVGDKVLVSDVFVVGDTIQVTGVSKGKGFAGGVKRHGFAGGPKTHGQSDRLRAPGSIGQGTTPGRVYKGKRMAGHMGVEQVTVKNLTVVAVDAANNELHVDGPVPGAPGSLIIVKRLSENKVVAPQQEAVAQTEEAETAEVAESQETQENV